MDGERLLVVVDYQKDFVDGALGFAGAENLDLRIAAKIKRYHDAGDMVVFTYDTHRKNYLTTQEGRKLPVEHCICGTPGWELYGETAKQQKEEDLCFQKPTFPSLELADYLVDGRFILAERDLTLPFRGSTNQRILDMKQTLAAGKPVFAEKYL